VGASQVEQNVVLCGSYPHVQVPPPRLSSVVLRPVSYKQYELALCSSGKAEASSYSVMTGVSSLNFIPFFMFAFYRSISLAAIDDR
jgi:hypothetical protein